MSKRITLTDNEIVALKDLLQDALDGYYSNDYLSIDDRLAKGFLQSIFKKIDNR